MAMQNYTPMRLAPNLNLDPGLRSDLLRVDRFLRQLTPFAARVPTFPQGTPSAGGGAFDHGLLAGLADDDHIQYLLLEGRPAGQTAHGSRNSGGTGALADGGEFTTEKEGTGGVTWTSVHLDNSAPANSLVVICLCTAGRDGSPTQTHDSITDSQGNTWTRHAFASFERPAALNRFAAASIWTSILTNALTTGVDTLAVTFSGTVGSRAMETRIFTAFDGATVSLAGSDFAGVDVNSPADPPASLTVGSLSSREYLFIRATSIADNNTTYTASSGYTEFIASHVDSTTTHGTLDDNVGARGEFQIATATTSTSAGPTINLTNLPMTLSLMVALQVDGGTPGNLTLLSGDDADAAKIELDGSTITANFDFFNFQNIGTTTTLSYIDGSDGSFHGPVYPTTLNVVDSAFRILGSGDATKKLAFEVDGITTATTRTITVPDWDGTAALFRSNKLRIGDASVPSHTLELVAGTAAVAPMLFTSGTLLTTPVTGALEFFGNRIYSTSSVGPTRRIVMMVASATALSSTRIPVATTAGEITNFSQLSYSDATKTLTVQGKISAITGGVVSPIILSEGGLNVAGKVNYGFGVGSYVDDPNVKVQAQYIDTSTSAINITGLYAKLRVEPASSSATNFIAMEGYAAVSSAAITPSGIGVGVVGLRGVVEINTTATIDSVTGLTGLIYTNVNGPTINNAYAIGVRWSHNVGTIVNAYGIYIQDPASSVTVTNNYMLYLENAQEGTTLNYSIYAAGGPSIHVGTFRLGDTTAATHRLELLAGTTGVAPLKIDSSGGPLLTSPVSGAVEYAGDFFYLTHSDAVRTAIVTRRAIVDLYTQAAAIGATTLYNPSGGGGAFLVTYTITTTTAGAGAGTIQFRINYTDDAVAQTPVGALLSLAALGSDSGSFVVWEGGAGLISYQTNNVGGFGAGAQYSLHVRITAL